MKNKKDNVLMKTLNPQIWEIQREQREVTRIAEGVRAKVMSA